MMGGAKASGTIETRRDEAVLTVVLAGDWQLSGVPEMRDVRRWNVAAVRDAGVQSLGFDSAELGQWDTSFLAFLSRIVRDAEAAGLKVEMGGLPEGVRSLLDLSQAVPEADAGSKGVVAGFFEKVGRSTMAIFKGVERYCVFVGQLSIDFAKFAGGQSTFRGRDFFVLLQQTGPQALPIVALLAFLTGLIIAFIGVIQLQKLAADIFVADLVGLVMTRELAAVMTGVIMAGRTGAAYAAQIGSMRVNEEIDALRSFGISPVQFLVVPKVVALVLMMPLLVSFANVVSILGGGLVAVAISDVSTAQYHFQIIAAVGVNDVLIGLFKSAVFGLIIALSGCYRGLNCGKDAAAVGRATTSAVVTAITWIVVVDAIFAVVFHILGI